MRRSVCQNVFPGRHAFEPLERRVLCATLDDTYQFLTNNPERLLTTQNQLRSQTVDALVTRNDTVARSLLIKAINQAFPPTGGADSSVYTSFMNDIAATNAFQFGTRDKLINLVSTYKLAQYWPEANWRPLANSTVPNLAAMKTYITNAATSYANYFNTNGITSVSDGAWVGQASASLGLATAYDWLGNDLSAASRSSIASTLITYNIAPITSAVARPSGNPFWASSNYSNWTAICVGSAIMSSLAIRSGDYNGTFNALNQSGVNTNASLPAHFEDLLAKGLPLLNTLMSSMQIQNGGWDEGPGYQADLNNFLFGLARSFEGSLADGQTQPEVVQTFLDNINTTASRVVAAVVHYAQPTGTDFAWSDGNWSLSPSPTNYLVAYYANQLYGNNGMWRAAAQQTYNQRSQTGTDFTAGQQVLYRSLFEWTQPYTLGTVAANGKPAMGGYTLSGVNIPTHYSFNSGYFGPTQSNIGSNENVNIWRSGWDNPNAAAVMFKGGDKRADRHDKLDAATFQYTALGTDWAVDIGDAAGYPGITLPNGSYTRYQTYPQRAVGENTLVINPTTNDYKTNSGYSTNYGALNPDQGIPDGTTWSFAAVDGQTFDETNGIYSANVQLSAIYARMKLSQSAGAASKRNFLFNKATGALTITDTLNFTAANNEVYWGMHTPASTTALRSTDGKEVALQRTVNGQTVYLDVKVLAASGTPNGYFSYGSLTSILPGGQPTQLWSFSNATQMQTNFEKLSLRLTGMGTSGTVQVVLTPMPAWTGKTSAQVLTLIGGGTVAGVVAAPTMTTQPRTGLAPTKGSSATTSTPTLWVALGLQPLSGSLKDLLR